MTLLTDEKMTNDRRQTADLGEAVGGEDHLIAICGGGPELRGSMNVRTELDEACCLTGDIQVIPRDHFDVNSSVADSVDGELCVVSRRVEHWNDAGEFHGTVIPRHCHGDGLVTHDRQFCVCVLHSISNLLAILDLKGA